MEITSRFGFLVVTLGVAMSIAPSASAQEGCPSAESCAGLHGAAFGLCNAACNAMHCGTSAQQASNNACSRVIGNYFDHTGEDLVCGVAACNLEFAVNGALDLEAFDSANAGETCVAVTVVQYDAQGELLGGGYEPMHAVDECGSFAGQVSLDFGTATITLSPGSFSSGCGPNATNGLSAECFGVEGIIIIERDPADPPS